MWRYLDRVFYQIDCLLNALLGGAEDQTISVRAALAQRRGARWGCWLCWWLAHTIERHHCARVLAGQPVRRWAAVAAGAQVLAVAGALFYGLPWLLAGW